MGGGGDAIIMGNRIEKQMHQHLQHIYNKIPSLIDNTPLIGEDILSDYDIQFCVNHLYGNDIKITNDLRVSLNGVDYSN